MPNHQPIDRVFHALSDATRMAVLERLCEGPASVSALAEPFDMALPSFTQHLRLLEDCDLVTSEKKGRVRTYQINPAPLKEAMGWLEQRKQMWEARLDRLDTYLLTLKHDTAKETS
jgi:DNA-binding transcriptional ArsR family regulator